MSRIAPYRLQLAIARLPSMLQAQLHMMLGLCVLQNPIARRPTQPYLER